MAMGRRGPRPYMALQQQEDLTGDLALDEARGAAWQADPAALGHQVAAVRRTQPIHEYVPETLRVLDGDHPQPAYARAVATTDSLVALASDSACLATSSASVSCPRACVVLIWHSRNMWAISTARWPIEIRYGACLARC